MTLWLWMSGKRNVSVCRGHELANALYAVQCPTWTSPITNRLLEASVKSLNLFLKEFNLRPRSRTARNRFIMQIPKSNLSVWLNRFPMNYSTILPGWWTIYLKTSSLKCGRLKCSRIIFWEMWNPWAASICWNNYGGYLFPFETWNLDSHMRSFIAVGCQCIRMDRQKTRPYRYREVIHSQVIYIWRSLELLSSIALRNLTTYPSLWYTNPNSSIFVDLKECKQYHECRR